MTPTRATAPLFLLTMTGVLMVAQLLGDLAAGGQAWRQADWLINDLGGPVRRGAVGSGLIAIADALGVTPVTVTVALQLGLLMALMGALARLVWRLPDPRVAVPLLLSPGFLLLAWTFDPDGALRKELAAFAGIALLALGVDRRGPAAVIGGTLLLALGMLAHEALGAFLPLAAVVLLGHRNRPLSMAACVVLGVATSVGLWQALRHPILADTAPVCAALTECRLDPQICSGAIVWLGHGLAKYHEFLARFSAPYFAGFVLAYAVSLAPVALVFRRAMRPACLAGWVVATALPFAPLYAVALDWGRWMGMHLFSLTILALVGIGTGRVDPPPPRWSVAAMVLVGLLCAALLGPRHVIGLRLMPLP